MQKTRKIMIVAGEASGDAHAAKLIRALRDTEPDTNFGFFGAAGPKMRAVGVEAVVHSDDLAIVGVAEIASALPMFLRASRDLKAAAETRKPDVVILVDFPDFNLRLAKALKMKGYRIAYYISPQLWAWRKYRAATIRKYVDVLLTILPFEKQWYAENGVDNVEYVGNPLVNEVNVTRSKDDFCRENDLDPTKPVISLLPGSRHKEIVRILPVMLEGAVKVAAEIPSVQFVIAIGSNKNRSDVETVIKENPEMPAILKVVEAQTYDALNASDAAAVTSGTATLETGIIGTPLVIVYKSSALNYVLLRPLISVPHYGLINLIAGERIARELIQNDFTATTVSSELLRLIKTDVNRAVRERLRKASDKLGQGGASVRAAEAILKLISQSA